MAARDPNAPIVVLAGNPNCGKSTLFNQLTGLRQHVGNYPGVTVEKKSGQAKIAGRAVTIVDLPGTYSLVSRSRDEAIAFEVLTGRSLGRPPDLTVLVLDASNLARNLYLALQVLELGEPAIVALNMVDEAEKLGLSVHSESLSEAIGVPVVPVVASSGVGLDQLREKIGAALQDPQRPPLRAWRLDDRAEAQLAEIAAALPETLPSRPFSAMWILSSLASSSDAATRGGEDDPFRALPEISSALSRAEALMLDGARTLPAALISARFELAAELASKSAVQTRPVAVTPTDRIDRVFLHPIFGPLCFLFTMALLFQSVFSWAEPLMDGIEALFSALGAALASALPPGALRDLLVEGVIAGVGSVLVFIPQIAILFTLLAILEDSGYLARAAYLMDKVMARVGLHGRAFVPLMSGFACAIPAIMSTRTIESRKDRLVTILVTPLMSCSARLPVYVTVIGALFADRAPLFGLVSTGTVLILAMYALSVVSAVGMAAIFKRTLLKSPTPPFVLELPPYRRPQVGTVLRRVYGRCLVFVRDAGTVILACSIVLWALLRYPSLDRLPPELEASRAEIAHLSPGDPGTKEAAQMLEAKIQAAALQNSVAGRIGRWMEPVIAPLGFDWKIGIGLLGSFAAREVLVSTLGLVYGIGKGADEDSSSLRDALRSERDPRTGARVYTPLVGLSLMIFFLFACQCMSTLAIVRRETGGWAWPAFMFTYMTALAYFASLVVYQGGRALGLG